MRLLFVGIAIAALSSCVSTAPIETGANQRGMAKPGAVTAAAAVQPDYSVYLNRPPLLPDYQRIELENGAVLLLLKKPDVPMIGFEAVIRGGATAEPASRSGTASLMAELLRKGAGDRNATEFAATVEGLGGELDTGAGQESVQVSGSFLSRDAEVGIGLLADLLMRPRLDESEFIKLRDRTVQFIKAAKDGSPNRLLGVYAAGFVFDGHPYSRPSFGDESSLPTIGIDNIKRFYREQIGADRLILAVTGDFETDQVVALLRNAFGSWRRAAAPLPEYGSAPRVEGGRVLLVDKPDATQTYFWMGNIGVSKYFPQRASLALANTVFGGRFTSMLNTALRIESGLTYGARSSVSQPRQAGSVAISSFTATETTVDAIDMALDVLDNLHESGLDAEAVASSKAYILGQFPLAFETAPQLARQMAQLEFYGLDTGYINAYAQELVKADMTGIEQVIESVYPARDELVFVLIGNAAAIRSDVAKYGTVTEMTITDLRFTP